ncbi:hypothetical protein PYCC9005_003916 [Savitreella phatthalungensis]
MVNAYQSIYRQPLDISDVIGLALSTADAFNGKNRSSCGPTSSTTTKVTPAKRTWQPDVDLYDGSDAVVIDIALPGVAKEEINVEYDARSNRLTVSGTSRPRHVKQTVNGANPPASPQPKPVTVADAVEDGSDVEVAVQEEPAREVVAATRKEDGEVEYRSVSKEIAVGVFERTISFHQLAIRPDAIKATHADGLLSLHVPKHQPAELKRRIIVA